MENMPYREGLETQMFSSATTEVTSSDWRTGLPVLTGGYVTLRELRTTDAASLFALLTTEEVSRFISPPPSTVEGFEKFITWAPRQRRAAEDGRCAGSRHAKVVRQERADVRPGTVCDSRK